MDIREIRDEIDVIDHKLVELLEQRMDAVVKIAEYKKETGKPIFDAQREKAVLDKVTNLVKNHEHKVTIRNTFEDIMKQSRAFQESQLNK